MLRIKFPWTTLRHQVHQDIFSFIVCECGLFQVTDSPSCDCRSGCKRIGVTHSWGCVLTYMGCVVTCLKRVWTSRLAILSHISLSESSTRWHLFQGCICTVASC